MLLFQLIDTWTTYLISIIFTLNRSQLIRFARASSHGNDFNNRNKLLIAILLKQCYLYYKPREAFSKLYQRHFELVKRYHVSLKKFIQWCISNPEIYGDLRKSFEIQTSLIFSSVL